MFSSGSIDIFIITTLKYLASLSHLREEDNSILDVPKSKVSKSTSGEKENRKWSRDKRLKTISGLHTNIMPGFTKTNPDDKKINQK